MFKHIFGILKNQAKIRLLDVGLEILINALQEFRRAQQTGQYDLNNQSNVGFTPPEEPKTASGSSFFERFKTSTK